MPGTDEAESTDRARVANLLGALALVVTDRVLDAIAAGTAQSISPAAALSAMYHFLEAPTIDRLRQVLGLTSSGTVRLVDTLERAGYVARGAGPDGRSTTVTLTDPGRQLAQAISGTRTQALFGMLGGLSTDEQTQLDELLGKLLSGMIRGPGATRWLCRLCDLIACGRAEGRCPVANAAQQRYGPQP